MSRLVEIGDRRRKATDARVRKNLFESWRKAINDAEGGLAGYLCEFEFRYNHRYMDDGERTRAAILASEGKRLTYEESKASEEAYGAEA